MKRAVVAIGTLLIFLAAILVAGVGAMTLIRTSSVLQVEAFKTGSGAKKLPQMQFSIKT